MTTPALGQDFQVPHISVSGEATVTVVPDKMEWSVGVRHTGPELEAAAAKHAQTVKSVLKFLKETKIPKKDTKTTGMSFGENWVRKDDDKRVQEGYFASTDVSFIVIGVDKYWKLWFGLSRIKNVSVDYVSHGHTKRAQHTKELRRKALLAAKARAAEMAKVLDCEIGEPLRITEQEYGRMYNVSFEDLDDEELGIAPGTITFSQDVTVVFRLIPAKKQDGAGEPQ